MSTNPEYSHEPWVTVAEMESDEETDFEFEFDTSQAAGVPVPDAVEMKYVEGVDQPPTAQPYKLAIYQSSDVESSKFIDSITQPSKKEDDSDVSYGDKIVQTIGNWQYAPSAPPLSADEMEAFAGMDDQIKKDYEEWLRETQLSERKRFKMHDRWQQNLMRTGWRTESNFSPILTPEDLPQDHLSAAFKAKIVDVVNSEEAKYKEAVEPAHNAFVHGVASCEGFSTFRCYVPATFRAKSEAKSSEELQSAWLSAHTETYDEVLQLVAASEQYKTKWRDPTKNIVPQDTLWVVSDHGGTGSGKKLEIWGPGNKPRFVTVKGKRKGRVARVPINTPYHHKPGRFTVVYILANELGFTFNKQQGCIQQLLPGRYFIHEHTDNYIGKAPVTLGEATEVSIHSSNQQAAIAKMAQRLQVVCVAAGHRAFCMSGEGVFIAPHQAEPWIIDRARDEEFISMGRCSDRVSNCVCHFLPSRPTYHVVNLQPDEYIVFRDNQANRIVWLYDEVNPRMNQVHLPSLYYSFDGRVEKVTAGTQAIEDVIIIKNDPQDFVVLRDPVGHVKFFETETCSPLVLRYPWQLVEVVPKATGSYCADRGEGRRVWRVVLTPAEWAVVQTRAGEIKFFPPMLLDGAPYYFYQPYFSVHGIVNRFATDVQEIELPGYKISVVNLATGEMGACRIQNVNMFLNPRPMNPYVFVSPDEFLGKAPVVKTHFYAGDLHYVRVNADERVCVIRDGEAILLPSEGNELAKSNKGNGVYIFRARQQLEVLGPHKKQEKSYTLGPWQFFNVPPGFVGYGTKAGKLHVWGEGQGSANTSNNEQFSGFFQTNVDPVVRDDVEVMCKHAITSKLKITVTYMITEPKKTIYTFGGDHGKLHRFIESLAISKILELCARSPPMGFSEADFDPRDERKDLSPEEQELTDKSKVSGELLNNLRSHPEVIRAGIHIGFAEIQEWKIDVQFMQSSKEIAMNLQQIHAITERKRMEVAQQKLDNVRAVENERSRIEQQKLQVEQEHIRAEANKQQAVILAQQAAATSVAKKEAELKQQELEAATKTRLATQHQEKKVIEFEQQRLQAEANKNRAVIQAQEEAATKQAFAEAEAAALAAKTRAEADAKVAKKEGLLREKALEAENAKLVAQTNQEKQLIQNATNLAHAEAEARMRSAAMTAEAIAKAKAAKLTAQLELEVAQTLLEANTLKAQAELAMVQARAQGEQMLHEAKVTSRFPGLSPQELAQCLLTIQMLDAQKDIAQRVKTVYHTMDPAEGQTIYKNQMKNMMAMSHAMRGFSYVPRNGLNPFAGFEGIGGMGMGMGMGGTPGTDMGGRTGMGHNMNGMGVPGMGMGMGGMPGTDMGARTGMGHTMNGMGVPSDSTGKVPGVHAQQAPVNMCSSTTSKIPRRESDEFIPFSSLQGDLSPDRGR